MVDSLTAAMFPRTKTPSRSSSLDTLVGDGQPAKLTEEPDKGVTIGPCEYKKLVECEYSAARGFI
jgi:hypothetical protein